MKRKIKLCYRWLLLQINNKEYYKGNKMEFLVLSRSKIKKYRTDKKHIIISICDSNARRVYLYPFPERIGILNLQFDDLDKEAEGYFLFDKSTAERILNFVNHYKDETELIICQCEAGISRSAGVAGALSKIINGDDKYFFKHFMPNRLVYRLLLEEADKRELMKKPEEKLIKRIEKALAKADKCKVNEQKNLLGSKKKYISAIIEEIMKC